MRPFISLRPSASVLAQAGRAGCRLVAAGHRREINYNSLHQGKYRFLVRAGISGGPTTESAYDFEMLPKFYETMWFVC
jgi:hypothetical protein